MIQKAKEKKRKEKKRKEKKRKEKKKNVHREQLMAWVSSNLNKILREHSFINKLETTIYIFFKYKSTYKSGKK